MLMLQRAAENVNPSECNDPAVLLACSLGSDSCPAACQKKADEKSDEPETSNINDMPIAGDLSVVVADYSSSVKSAPAKGTVVFNAVDFKASEKITIESIKLERIGLSDKSAIKWVWFEKDGIAVSAKASLSSDGTATTRFYNNYSVNGTETLDLVAELSWAAGSEIAFHIMGVTSTAKNVSADTTTTTYRTTTYNVATVNFKANGSVNGTEYKLGEKTSYEIGRFEIQNDVKGGEDKDVIVKSLKLKNDENANLAAILKNVYVTRDSKTVSKNVELNNREMVITFDDQIDSGKRGIYTIFAEIAQLENVPEKIKLTLNKTTELVANEKNSNFRVGYAAEMSTNSLSLNTYTFNGGKLTFSNDSSFAKTIEAAAGSTDVAIAKGTLTVAEPVKFKEGLTITATTKADPINSAAKESYTKAQSVKDHINTLKLEIGGSTYNANLADTCPASAKVSKTDYACYVINDEIYVSKTSDVRVLVSLRSSDADKDTIVFSNIRGESWGIPASDKDADKVKAWDYEQNDKKFYTADIAGTVQVADLVVNTGKFFITNKSTSTKKVVSGNSDEVVIFEGEITSNKGKVTVNDLILTGNKEWDHDLTTNEQISLTVYVNWEALSDTIYRSNSTSVKFSNLGDVEANKSMKVKITAQPTITLGDGKSYSISFDVGAIGTDSEGNDAKATAASSSKLQITTASEVTVANSDASSTVEKDGSSAELAKFTATVKNGSLSLESVKLETNATQLGTCTFGWSQLDGKFSKEDCEAKAEPAKQAVPAVAEEVTNPEWNPSTSAYYEKSPECTSIPGKLVDSGKCKYTASADTTVTADKTYYTLTTEGTDAVAAKNAIWAGEATQNPLVWKNMYLEVDGNRLASTTVKADWSITFSNIYETLSDKKHDFSVVGYISADDMGNNSVTVGKVYINGVEKGNLKITKLFMKSFPKLSVAKSDTNNNEITIRIDNPEVSDSTNEDITIVGLDVAGDLASASLKDSPINGNLTSLTNPETIAPGSYIELRLQARNPGDDGTNVVQLRGIKVKVDTETVYDITSTYKNVAKWADLKITYKK